MLLKMCYGFTKDFNFPNLLLFKKKPAKTSDEKIGTIYVPYFFLNCQKKKFEISHKTKKKGSSWLICEKKFHKYYFKKNIS